MKQRRLIECAVVLILALGQFGCGKGANSAAKPLEQSFQQVEPEAKQAIQQASSALREKNYAQAVDHLAPVVQNRTLTEEQKKAITATLQQINAAIAANPKLETPEMYKKRQQMFNAVYGTKRF